MAVELGAVYTLTGPDSTVAVFNNPASGNFVGYLTEIGGLDSPEVRESSDNVVEGDGGIHGSFYYGRRPITLEGLIDPTSGENAKMDRLFAASNAMRSDATLTWSETGGATKRLLLRRQNLRISDRRPKRFLLGMVAADARIYNSTVDIGPVTTSPVTNAGNTDTYPTFTFTPSGNGTVILTNSTTAQALTLTVGTGYLATSAAVTVDFAARTVTQSGNNFYHAVSFPSSVWWALRPGSNAWTRTGTATISSAASISARSAWI